MSVLVRIGRKKAILCAGKWSCADLRLEEQLQAALEVWVLKTGGPPIGNADPDKYAAEAMRHELDYEVLITNRPKKRAPQNAYLSKRQYRLPF
jgi:hypothetical protein